MVKKGENVRRTGALVQVGVATSCLADSFLKASHITPTRDEPTG